MNNHTLPPSQGPEYTPCACSHIEPEHDINGRWCAIDGCACSLYRPAGPAGQAPAADRAALRQRIAQALAAVFTSEGETTQGMRVIEEDPDEGASVRRVRPLEAADAVLAVLPPPVSRADVRAEAFDEAAEMLASLDPAKAALAGQHAWNDAAGLVRHMAVQERRMADEATAEHHTVDGTRYLCHTDDHYCPDSQRRMADEAQPAGPATDDEARP